VIVERLECLLNLKIVTAGTKIHEVMEDCIRIAKGVTTDDNVYVRIAKGIILFRFSYLDDAYNFVVVENIGVFPNIL